jgi:hypothetical protein
MVTGVRILQKAPTNEFENGFGKFRVPTHTQKTAPQDTALPHWTQKTQRYCTVQLTDTHTHQKTAPENRATASKTCHRRMLKVRRDRIPAELLAPVSNVRGPSPSRPLSTPYFPTDFAAEEGEPCRIQRREGHCRRGRVRYLVH